MEANSVKLGDLPRLHFAPPATYRNRSKHARFYNRELCAFDIETTVIPFNKQAIMYGNKQAIMYVWQFAIETDFVVIGRTWEEFTEFVKLLNAISGGRKLICLVHNLSFEFQFLSGIHHFLDEEVFCQDSREILRADWDCLEFRCSYKLTNLSLDALTTRYDVQHHKLSGAEYDYSKQRFPWSPLSDQEQAYIINDVVGLIEAVHKIMELYEDDVNTLPLTATGFVRRLVKHDCRPDVVRIRKLYPDYEVFRLLRANFRGGNTHANRYYAAEVIEGETIHSYDISSSYPSVQCNRLYPMSRFRKQKNLYHGKIDRLIDHNQACLFQVEFWKIELRDRYIAIPYIPLAKCNMQTYRGVKLDNGRILKADYISCVLTDIDWKIIVKQYKAEHYNINVIYCSIYDKLPSGIVQNNIEFYKLKTTLKGVDGQELFYQKNKELLNSIYGLTVQNPCKAMTLLNDFYWEDIEDVPEDKRQLYIEDDSKTEEELLTASQKRAFISYQWGCWTTAHARAALQYGIDLCGDDLLYVDTDSVKFLGDHDFTSYNEEQKKLSLSSGLHATDPKGVEHYGGLYEKEADMKAFITHGAKKYAYIDMNDKIHTTIAGVSKRRGAEALTKAGGLQAFKPGFVFRNCGKTQSIYNDENMGKCYVDGHIINITRNVVIEDKDYTVSHGKEYDIILDEAHLEQSKRFMCRAMQNMKNVSID